ncbi:MAG: hypothetical protein L0Y42_05540 [Phycisphaerales bacterium]|nr:hypothetical protein [Phycisphaerales bacterium]
MPRNASVIVDRQRLLPIPDLRNWYPDLGFSGRSQLVTAGEPILVTDPIYLADVFNANADPVAVYVRLAGVIVNDFGGDTSCPVWWHDPFLVLPTSAHIDFDRTNLPTDSVVLAQEIGCDSASFVFLAMRGDMPRGVNRAVDKVLQQRNGALLKLPKGKFSFWLEQFEGYPQPNMAGLYRNIVAERIAAPT